MKKFKKFLKWERVVLKRNIPTIKIATKIFDTVDKNREHLKPRFTREKETKTIEDTLKYLFEDEKESQKWKKAGYWIYLKNKYIGNIWIFDINKENKSAEIGYWLSKEFTRKWYMTEAIKILEKEFFKNFDINRIEICCDENNIASKWVAEKCWYKLEWKLREHIYNKEREKYTNTLIFSKLKSEYKK